MKSTILCPDPGTCEFDDFRRTGNHFCMRIKCPYSLSVRALLEGRVAYLKSLKKPTRPKISKTACCMRLLESG